MRIAVCEHGVGNVRSVVRAIEQAAPRAEVVLTRDPEELVRADRVVVPGQGSFGAFAAAMDPALREALTSSIRAGVPYLGICLGLQVLFDESDEAPGERGLGILRGRVRRLEPGLDPATQRRLPLPHIGWNTATPRAPRERLLGSAAFYYFAHSYAAVPDDAGVIVATTDYGASFVSAVAKDNVLGVQFHPEKSQREGLALLERFFG